MKMILASDLSFLLNYGYDLTGIPKDQMRIGYVTTASKGDRNTSFFEGVRKGVLETGLAIEEIDIQEKPADELRAFFQDKNVIHVEGGNTFYLLKAIRNSGFAEVLKEFLDNGNVYIGTSAGAYIMCPTIEVADWDTTGKPRFDMTDFTALNYVPFVLKVHYKDEMKSLVKENMKNLKYPLRILKDGQGIIIKDSTYSFIGDGEEVIL